MTTPDALLYKLRWSISKCSPNGIALPLWVSDVREIIEFIEARLPARDEAEDKRQPAEVNAK